MTVADLNVALPEVLLALYAIGALMFGAFGGQDRAASVLLWSTAAVLFVFGAWIGISDAGRATAFEGLFIQDAFARFAKVLILISAAFILLMSEGYMTRRGLLRFEYPILIVIAAIGMMVMVSANDLLIFYMGIELQSLALYVIAALRRDSVKSTEAGLKYFVLGALSSGLLLYGASLTYGYAGTTNFEGILAAVGDQTPLGLLFGLTFVAAGLAFKVSAAPFHMWTPDVYEGAPTPVTAFFATAPKVAAMALFARIVHQAYGGVVGDWQQIVALLAVASMFLGAIAAIGQTNIKRLMAYSSINHMGYALIGLAAGTAQGVEAMLIYMAIYVTMNIGVFAFILSMQRDGQPVVDINSLSQLGYRDQGRALAVLVLFLSLAGVPPNLGFFGKYAVFDAAVSANLVWLAVAGGIASVIGAFYYLRIVYLMWFGREDGEMDPHPSTILWGITAASAVIMVVGLVNLFGVSGPAEAAATTLVN